MDPRWNRSLPEFSAVANAVSLLMPHLEPLVVQTAREARVSLGPDSAVSPGADLAGRVDGYIAQEARHHVEHRRFNTIVAERYGLARIESWMATTARWLGRRSLAFRLSWSAGFETVAFVTARWVDKRATRLFNDVDELPAALFLWHLAEEVEHRDIADELVEAHGLGLVTRLLGMFSALIILGWFTVLGAIRQMTVDRRVLNPFAWLRLVTWGISYAFEALPMLAMTIGKTSRTSQLLAPEWLAAWLDGQDPSGGTIAPFAVHISSGQITPSQITPGRLGPEATASWPRAS
jgi:uncharacterized protein